MVSARRPASFKLPLSCNNTTHPRASSTNPTEMTRRVEALEGQLEPPPTEERAQELAALRDQRRPKRRTSRRWKGRSRTTQLPCGNSQWRTRIPLHERAPRSRRAARGGRRSPAEAHERAASLGARWLLVASLVASPFPQIPVRQFTIWQSGRARPRPAAQGEATGAWRPPRGRPSRGTPRTPPLGGRRPHCWVNAPRRPPLNLGVHERGVRSSILPLLSSFSSF